MRTRRPKYTKAIVTLAAQGKLYTRTRFYCARVWAEWANRMGIVTRLYIAATIKRVPRVHREK